MEGVRGVGIALWHWWVTPSDYLVHKNTIEIETDKGNGVELFGSPTGAVVSQNDVIVDSPSDGAGIFGLFTSNALVSNNRVSGMGFVGIVAIASDYWTVLGNNVQLFAGLAPIGLGDCWNFRVVGGNNAANVFVDGGGGHVMTGVNVSQYSGLGQDISAVMARKRDIAESML